MEILGPASVTEESFIGFWENEGCSSWGASRMRSPAEENW
jgi:hypothetical protein